MNQSTYPEKSWVDPRLEKRPSPIHGTGVFAAQAIRAGERLVIPGGIVFTSEDKQAGRVHLDPGKEYNEDQLDEDLFMVMPIDEDISYWFSHSCDPNFWGDVARRDIAVDEEITTDYALCIADEDYRLAPCRCGTSLCRHEITGNDWQLPELQQRYRGHFVPFIERKIQAMNEHSKAKGKGGRIN